MSPFYVFPAACPASRRRPRRARLEEELVRRPEERAVGSGVAFLDLAARDEGVARRRVKLEGSVGPRAELVERRPRRARDALARDRRIERLDDGKRRLTDEL